MRDRPPEPQWRRARLNWRSAARHGRRLRQRHPRQRRPSQRPHVAPPEFGGIGGRIGIIGPIPGTAAYDNIVAGNYLQGNGLAGVVMHARHPGGEDINGNQIIGNTFATNTVMGDPFDGGVSDFQTTAIAIYSVPTATLTITGNTIRSNAIGIWLTSTITALGPNDDKLEITTTPVVVLPPNSADRWFGSATTEPNHPDQNAVPRPHAAPEISALVSTR